MKSRKARNPLRHSRGESGTRSGRTGKEMEKGGTETRGQGRSTEEKSRAEGGRRCNSMRAQSGGESWPVKWKRETDEDEERNRMWQVRINIFLLAFCGQLLFYIYLCRPNILDGNEQLQLSSKLMTPP